MLSPVVDVVEVGTGGGSIAWIDEVGALKVGPRSAGADPGPICYRRRRRPSRRSPTPTSCSAASARSRSWAARWTSTSTAPAPAIERADRGPLGLEPARRPRTGSSRSRSPRCRWPCARSRSAKGYDPRDFVLLASGGAGPLHAVAIARELHIPRVDRAALPRPLLGRRDAADRPPPRLVRTIYAPLRTDSTPIALRAIYGEMAGQLRELIEPARAAQLEAVLRHALRGPGLHAAGPGRPSDELDAGDLARDPRAASTRCTSAATATPPPTEQAEVVNLRVTGLGRREKPRMTAAGARRRRRRAGAGAPVHFDAGARADRRADLRARRARRRRATVDGPALIEEYASTTVALRRRPRGGRADAASS